MHGSWQCVNTRDIPFFQVCQLFVLMAYIQIYFRFPSIPVHYLPDKANDDIYSYVFYLFLLHWIRALISLSLAALMLSKSMGINIFIIHANHSTLCLNPVNRILWVIVLEQTSILLHAFRMT